MRNLKKFLALVLAMMMTLSLMITVNAASDFTDVDTITDEFSEGVAVLEGLEVFEGYPDKTFKPKNSITRAEVATIVYRLATGDVEGVQAHLYADYQKFDDVKADHWAAGYINYCANAEWIAGYGNGKFGPNDNVTGYQAAAMILRAVGYGQNNEFKGSGWQVQVANVTRSEGLLENVNKTTYAATLNQPATRELVAEILFQAGNINTVKWTMLQGYQNSGNGSLGWQNFRLRVGSWMVVDNWGNPGYKWYAGSTAIATVTAEPDMEAFTVAQHECDIAHALKIDDQQDFVLYLNGKTPVTKNYRIVATDTVTKVGGQGRLTKVYDTLDHPWDGREYPDGRDGWVYDLDSWDATVTMVDTFLAKVTGVSNAVLDAAGHVIVPAKLSLQVYDTNKGANAGSASTVSKKSTDATNWDYSVGDMILMNAYTDRGTHTGANVEKAAYEPETVAATREQGTNAWVLHVADSKVAKQTTVYWNQQKHQVDGTDIPDQIDLFLDVAGTTTNSDFTWYFDDYKNIIGIGETVKSNYGVITSIYSSFSAADGATDGNAVAKAHVKFADGSENDVIIDRFLVSNNNDLDKGHGTANTAMLTNGTFATELLPVYDFSAGSSDVMTAGPAAPGYQKPSNVALSGQLFVSPVASINKANEGKQNGVDNGSGTKVTDDSVGYFGIIEQNLFKFVTSGDGKVTAMEVAGKYDPATPANENTGVYAKNYNGVSHATDTVELKKNAGFLSVGSVTVRLDNNTKIVLKEANGINVYDGLNGLPGDISIAKLTEVDWADANGDGIADVLYTAATVKGTVTYGLFYYNGGAAQWNSTDKKGTLAGYLNGKAEVVTFDNETEFNIVLSSMGGTVYAGHLFAVRMTNDVVTELMGAGTETNHKEQFLMTNAGAATSAVTLGTSIKLPGTTAGDVTAADGIKNLTSVSDGTELFKVSTGSGNDYTSTTQAVWFHDVADNDPTSATSNKATYNAATGTITTNTTEYYLTGVSKTLGSDLNYLNRKDYTNDITIVYDVVNTKNIITEIYVTTLPDFTPGTTTLSISGPSAVVVTSATEDELKANLKLAAAQGNKVLFDDGDVALTGLADGSSVPGKTLFFPYMNTSAGASVIFQVWDTSTGEVVWSETDSSVPVGANIFYFDFTTYKAGVTALVNKLPLTSGTNYGFSIYVNGALVSSGSFNAV